MSSGSLAGKVALITGGTKGVGKATAIRLAKDGAKVVITYASDSSAAMEVVEQIGKDHCLAIQADAGNLTAVEGVVDATIKSFGKIDILLPNAAVSYNLDLASATEDAFDSAFNVNVKGPLFLCQKATPHMGDGSRVILLSSNLCWNSTVLPHFLLYTMTKGAIEQMTRVLARDLGGKGIRVNAVAPGPVGTDLFYKGMNEELMKTLIVSPMNKLGETDEIADVIAFLTSNDSRWVNGQIIKVNGGLTIG